jgi:hypothetical protein
MNRIDDDKLKNGAASYVRQIAKQCAAEGGSDIACIVILARPIGDGEFSVIQAGLHEGHAIDGPTQRKIFRHLHNEAGVIHAPPPPNPGEVV